MLRDAAVTLILNRVGQRGGSVGPIDTVLQAQILSEFLVQQEELEHAESGLMPWFLEQEYENAAFKTAASVITVAWPPSFLREQDEQRCALFYQDTSVSGDQWVPIPKADYDELKTKFGGEVPGKPQGYCLMGTNYRFFPTPDAIYPLRALVHVADTTLATNIENGWLRYAGRLIIGKTGLAIAALAARDDAATAYFQDMMTKGLAGLHVDNVARKEAGRSRQMGED